jgi:hypothetical protein
MIQDRALKVLLIMILMIIKDIWDSRIILKRIESSILNFVMLFKRQREDWISMCMTFYMNWEWLERTPLRIKQDCKGKVWNSVRFQRNLLFFKKVNWIFQLKMILTIITDYKMKFQEIFSKFCVESWIYIWIKEVWIQ